MSRTSAVGVREVGGSVTANSVAERMFHQEGCSIYRPRPWGSTVAKTLPAQAHFATLIFRHTAVPIRSRGVRSAIKLMLCVVVLLSGFLSGCFSSEKPLLTEDDAVTPFPDTFALFETDGNGN